MKLHGRTIKDSTVEPRDTLLEDVPKIVNRYEKKNSNTFVQVEQLECPVLYVLGGRTCCLSCR